MSLEIIARNRWHEPLATWPIHDENHKTTIFGSKVFDLDCLRCWVEKVATEEYEKAINQMQSDNGDSSKIYVFTKRYKKSS